VTLPVRAVAARTLLLALDAVPYRVAVEAVARGAFVGWAPPAALVAPFPSLTHPGFAALFEPFGVAPSWGNEIRYYDRASNEIVARGAHRAPVRTSGTTGRASTAGRSGSTRWPS
jgi:hypothetical protein